MQAAAQIGQAEGGHPAGQERDDGAEQDAEDADVGAQRSRPTDADAAPAARAAPVPAALTGARCKLILARSDGAVGSCRAVGVRVFIGGTGRGFAVLDRAGVDGGLDRQAGTDQGAQRRIRIEHDLDRHTLHHLGEVAGGVVRRQQRERAAGAGRPAVDMAGQRQIRKSIDRDARGVAETHVGHLRLLVVRDHPDLRQRHHRDHLCADIDELALADLAQADQPVRR